ncbi:hypothetical protein JCM10449v2_001316 [Rhodotorula kratochvilovae]
MVATRTGAGLEGVGPGYRSRWPKRDIPIPPPLLPSSCVTPASPTFSSASSDILDELVDAHSCEDHEYYGEVGEATQRGQGVASMSQHALVPATRTLAEGCGRPSLGLVAPDPSGEEPSWVPWLRGSLDRARDSDDEVLVTPTARTDSPASPSYPFPRMPPSTPPPTLRSSVLMHPADGRLASHRPALVSAFSTWSSSHTNGHAKSSAGSSSSNASYLRQTETATPSIAPTIARSAPRPASASVAGERSSSPPSPTLRLFTRADRTSLWRAATGDIGYTHAGGSSSRSPSPTLVGHSAPFFPDDSGLRVNDSLPSFDPFDDVLSRWEYIVETVDPTDFRPPTAALEAFEVGDGFPWVSLAELSDEKLAAARPLAPALPTSSSLAPSVGHSSSPTRVAQRAGLAQIARPSRASETKDRIPSLAPQEADTPGAVVVGRAHTQGEADPLAPVDGDAWLEAISGFHDGQSDTADDETPVYTRARTRPPTEAPFDSLIFPSLSPNSPAVSTSSSSTFPTSLASSSSLPPDSPAAFAFLSTDPFPHSPRPSKAAHDTSPPPSPSRSCPTTKSETPFKRLRRRVSRLNTPPAPAKPDIPNPHPSWLGKLAPRLSLRRQRSSSAPPTLRSARSTADLRRRERTQTDPPPTAGEGVEGGAALSDSHGSSSSASTLVAREPYARETILLVSKQEREVMGRSAYGNEDGAGVCGACACCGAHEGGEARLRSALSAERARAGALEREVALLRKVVGTGTTA